ncbi:frataxin [Pokkaliibacter plantistimulans]|uniref:Iron-sulfur cluster assembly protein CyaY n=1 Tax=Pokkaliibacter plantistimulans TaxID=1635171 RepID=A0ABX5LVH5_9GAMM|nr:iron donor protein CyaY [Pokkaliibacter plantistimulans]PXF29463.1 frataxin [Pokkaliibacter plantistimulans]
MTESEFHQQVDDTLEQVETILDDAESDLDVNLNNGILTVICENGSRIILTRQTPVKQLWLATKQDGYHFDWDSDEGCWLEKAKGGTLAERLQEALHAQAGETLTFAL